MDTHQQDELIGRIYRHKTEDRKRLSAIDAELSEIATLFRKAGAQLEALLAKQRSELQPVLAKLNVDHVLRLLAEREQLHTRMAEANAQLRNLGVRV
jgi:uncharacterized protein YPO0396